MIRLFFFALGILIFTFGVIALVSPIPFGFVFIPLGLAMMLWASPWMRGRLRRFRAHHPNFDRKLREAEDWLPDWLAAPLRHSRPKEPPPEDASSPVA